MTSFFMDSLFELKCCSKCFFFITKKSQETLMHYMPAFKCNRILNISGGKPGHFQIEAANLSILGIKGVILCGQGFYGPAT